MDSSRIRTACLLTVSQPPLDADPPGCRPPSWMQICPQMQTPLEADPAWIKNPLDADLPTLVM